MTLGEIIREYTTDHSMSAFLRDSGLSKAYTYMLINNRNNNGQPIVPSIETIRKVANGVHKDFNEVFSSLDPDMTVTTRDDRERTKERDVERLAWDILSDPNLFELFKLARDAKYEDVQLTTEFLKRMKGE